MIINMTNHISSPISSMNIVNNTCCCFSLFVNTFILRCINKVEVWPAFNQQVKKDELKKTIIENPSRRYKYIFDRKKNETHYKHTSQIIIILLCEKSMNNYVCV